MKRCILLIALLGTCVGALEITVMGGGNYQAMNPEYSLEGTGWGAHGGLLGEVSTVPSFLGINLGLESGVLLQQANYLFIPALLEYPERFVHQANLIIPLLLKLKLASVKAFHFQWGVGPSLIRNVYGWWEDAEGGEGVVDKQYYETDLGLQLKGEINIRLSPKLWLNPAITRQFNLTAKDTWLDKGQNWFFSLGLALKP
ncbi:MAG: hypothetical protein E3J71_06310 [Candidatus Stahlbacteria bacterium]|nr:MAG: hypothetical protein E3J71_06310 [Candidatus Stahlbacteria bacterium]